MALEMRTASHSFSGTGTQSGSVSFASSVTNALVVLTGFNGTYGNTDHHMKTIAAQVVSTSFSGNTVSYTVSFDMEDDSNNHMSGTVNLGIIAETI